MRSFSLFVLVAAMLVRAGEYDTDKATVKDFNCPSLADNAIIRLKPCYKNTNYLTVCTDKWCNPTDKDIVIRELAGDDLKFAEWRIKASGSLPDGHITLTNVGKAGELAVDETNGYYPDNWQGRDAMLSTAAPKDAKMVQWRWDLRPEKWACRVLLRNALTEKKLGLIRNNGPKQKDNMKTFSIFKDGSALTDETWEVEFVRMAPAEQATGVAGVAGAGAKVADVAPVTVTVTSTKVDTKTEIKSVTTTKVDTSTKVETKMVTTTQVSTSTATSKITEMKTVTVTASTSTKAVAGYDLGPETVAAKAVSTSASGYDLGPTSSTSPASSTKASAAGVSTSTSTSSAKSSSSTSAASSSSSAKASSTSAKASVASASASKATSASTSTSTSAAAASTDYKDEPDGDLDFDL